MAKPDPIEKISTDFVEAIRASWNGDLAFTPAVLAATAKNGWDQVDILEVAEEGSPTAVRKESPYETLIELTHSCLSGITLRVVLAHDPHLPALAVKEVSAF